MTKPISSGEPRQIHWVSSDTPVDTNKTSRATIGTKGRQISKEAAIPGSAVSDAFKSREKPDATPISKKNNVTVFKKAGNFSKLKKITSSIAKRIENLTKPNLDKNLSKLENKVKHRIAELNSKGYLNANDKEELTRLITLEKAIDCQPENVKVYMSQYSSDAMYKHMGSVKFLSMLAMSRENTKNQAHNLTDHELVAIYGWTTGDYVALNKALREAGNEEIKDSGLNTYLKHVISGMDKLPDVPAPLTLHRAIFPPLPSPIWADTLKENSTYRDFGFMSTTNTQLDNQGVVNLKFEFSAVTATHAKKLGIFSAWPKENEVLIMPNVEFNITKSEAGRVTLEPKKP